MFGDSQCCGVLSGSMCTACDPSHLRGLPGLLQGPLLGWWCRGKARVLLAAVCGFVCALEEGVWHGASAVYLYRRDAQKMCTESVLEHLSGDVALRVFWDCLL